MGCRRQVSLRVGKRWTHLSGAVGLCRCPLVVNPIVVKCQVNGVWQIVVDDTNCQPVLIEAMQDSLSSHLMNTAGNTSRLVSFVERCG